MKKIKSGPVFNYPKWMEEYIVNVINTSKPEKFIAKTLILLISNIENFDFEYLKDELNIYGIHIESPN